MIHLHALPAPSSELSAQCAGAYINLYMLRPTESDALHDALAWVQRDGWIPTPSEPLETQLITDPERFDEYALQALTDHEVMVCHAYLADDDP